MNLPLLREETPLPGQVERLSPLIRRVLCGNPGPFTYRGTNTWLIGGGASVAVLDPGPADAAHLEAILRATAGERITHILVSHTHRDHSPGAAALRAATGAPTYGFGPHATPPEAGGEGGDHAFAPDQRLGDGASVEGADWRLTALFTPGHCANHLAFALDGTGALFSADHVMGWSTSVVSPPDGSMRDYLASLARLRAREGEDSLYLPGHGPPIREPIPFLDGLAAHRRKREARIVAALSEHGAMTVERLVGPVYGPMDPRLAMAAARSLLAHLLMLEEEGVAAHDAAMWRLT
jgi:glyoxylase-like metal-dependent hydrolase (beta-lactamase superfamily II)